MLAATILCTREQTEEPTAMHRIHEDLIFLLFKVNKLNWASRQQARVTAVVDLLKRLFSGICSEAMLPGPRLPADV